LSPRLAFHRARTEKWKAELTWWDFYADVLDRAPESAKESFKADWREFPWRDGKGESKSDLERWQAGATGFRSSTPECANSTRPGSCTIACAWWCVVLTKHLLIDWRVGEEYFAGFCCAATAAKTWATGNGSPVAVSIRRRIFAFSTDRAGREIRPKRRLREALGTELRDVTTSIYEPWKLKSPPKNYPRR
jgi:deoxyribodipyrimidine photo-lyase